MRTIVIHFVTRRSTDPTDPNHHEIRSTERWFPKGGKVFISSKSIDIGEIASQIRIKPQE